MLMEHSLKRAYNRDLTERSGNQPCIQTTHNHKHLLTYRVAHKKKWTILFCCLQPVYHIHTESFYNISEVSKTLIKMLCNVSITEASRFRNCPIARSVGHVYL